MLDIYNMIKSALRSAQSIGAFNGLYLELMVLPQSSDRQTGKYDRHFCEMENKLKTFLFIFMSIETRLVSNNTKMIRMKQLQIISEMHMQF